MFKYTEKSDELIRECSKFIRKLYEETFQTESFNLNLVGFEIGGLATICDFISTEDAKLQQLYQRNIQNSFALFVNRHTTAEWSSSTLDENLFTTDSQKLMLHDAYGKNLSLLLSPCDKVKCSCVKNFIETDSEILATPPTQSSSAHERKPFELSYTGGLRQLLVLTRPSFNNEAGREGFHEATSVPSIEAVNCVAAVKLSRWPQDSAETWRTRTRKWPVEEIVYRAAGQQVLAVSRSAVVKELNDDRWILDFSESENILIESLDENLRRIFVLCCSVRNGIFPFTEDLVSATWFNRVLVLHSFFWMLEKHGITHISTSEEAITISQIFLETVKEFLKSSFIPHYFLPHVNLLSLINLPADHYTHSLQYQINEASILELSNNLLNLPIGDINSTQSDEMVHRELSTYLEDSTRLIVRQLISRLHAVDSVDESIKLHVTALSKYRNTSSAGDSDIQSILNYLESSLGRLYCAKASDLPGLKSGLFSGDMHQIQAELSKDYTNKLLEIDSLPDLGSTTANDCMRRSLMHTLKASEVLPHSQPCIASFIVCCLACNLPKDFIANRLFEFYKMLNESGKRYARDSINHQKCNEASGEYDVEAVAVRSLEVGNSDPVNGEDSKFMEDSWQFVEHPTSLLSGERSSTADIPFSAQLSKLFTTTLDSFDILFSRLDSKILPSSLAYMSDLLCQDIGSSHHPLAKLNSSYLCSYLFVEALAESGQMNEALSKLESMREDLLKYPIPGELEDRVWPVYLNATAELYSRSGEKVKAIELLTRSRELFRSPRNRASWIMLRWKMINWMRKGIGLSVIVGGVIIAIWVLQWK